MLLFRSRLKFLPEGHTDFVFSVFAEQWGFIGVLVLFVLFAALIFLAAEIAFKAKDPLGLLDRKSTRLNSSHLGISYAVFCLKKNSNTTKEPTTALATMDCHVEFSISLASARGLLGGEAKAIWRATGATAAS